MADVKSYNKGDKITTSVRRRENSSGMRQTRKFNGRFTEIETRGEKISIM